MAHVYGHCDFFKNNAWFSPDQSQDDGRDGQPRQPHPPLHGPLRRRGGRGVHRLLPEHRGPDRHPLAVHQAARRAASATISSTRPTRTSRVRPGRFHAKDYMDSFINPPEVLWRPRLDAAETEARPGGARFPAEPVRDVMLFVLEHAPLKSWQLDVLSIAPRRGLLLRPAGPDQDHERRLGQLLALDDHDPAGPVAGRRDPLLRPPLGHDGHQPRPAESVQAGDRAVPRHRRALEPRPVRPANTTSATTWPPSGTGTRDTGLGRQKIFEVRRIHNDLTFIDTFLTLDFCREHKLFSFGYNAGSRLLRDREPRVSQDQAAAAVQPDEPRPAADHGPRRQLQEPRRAVPRAPVQRRRAARGLRTRYAAGA